MNDVFCVQVLDAEADVYEDFPYEVVHEWLDNFTLAQLLLPLDQSVEVTNRTVLKHKVDFLVFNE